MRITKKPRIQSAHVKVDNRGQRYIVYPDGQMRRLSPNGNPLPRVKMTKKERIKLRREYQEVKELNQKDLANKILEAPVINPVAKSDVEPIAESTDA
jgi:hypothetical protein